jgi:broad specificity phosphatase PhoE
LRELERGEWAGLTRSELEDRWPGSWANWFAAPATTRPPGGESLDDLYLRVLPRVESWAAAHTGRCIALVTHGWVVRVLACHAMQAHLDLAPRLDIRTADITVIRWRGRVPSSLPELEALALDSSPDQLSE